MSTCTRMVNVGMSAIHAVRQEKHAYLTTKYLNFLPDRRPTHDRCPGIHHPLPMARCAQPSRIRLTDAGARSPEAVGQDDVKVRPLDPASRSIEAPTMWSAHRRNSVHDRPALTHDQWQQAHHHKAHAILLRKLAVNDADRRGDKNMPYDLWHCDQQASAGAQAFVFDGWSHELLVLHQAPEAEAAPQRQEQAAVERKVAQSFT